LKKSQWEKSKCKLRSHLREFVIVVFLSRIWPCVHIDKSSLSYYSIVSLLVVLLSWFVDDEKVMNAMHDNILIEEEDVK